MSDRPSLPTPFSFVYERFDSRHYGLFVRTWSSFIAKGEAKPIREAQLRHVYESNPSGRSVISVVEEHGAWIGAVSALATTVVLPGGSKVRAYQIGDFMVDPAHQRRGLGGALLRHLTEFLRGLGEPVYTFPNVRSAGAFVKQSYDELRTVPAFAYPPVMMAVAARPGRRGRVRELSLDEACSIADALATRPRRRGALEKSGEQLRWRYAGMRDASAYTFAAVERPEPRGAALVVWTCYRYRGVPVQVVLETIGDDQAPLPLREVAWPAVRQGAVLTVVNIDRVRSPVGRPALALPIPRRFDPRPARLFVPPHDERSRALFAECSFSTGDWMGF